MVSDGQILSWIIFLPLVGAAVLLFAPPGRNRIVKIIAAVASGLPLVLALDLYRRFDPGLSGLQFRQQVPWIGLYKIEYFVGVDGLSIAMLLLTQLLSLICILASWGIEHWHESRGVKGYFALFLMLQAGMSGVFCAMDFFLFYVFWEVMLLPMYFLIGIWGGPKREYAAIKFFLYTLAGSVLMLVVLLAFYFTKETFNLEKLREAGTQGAFAADAWKWAFLALFVGFAIKVPVFPFHTWLPLAHVEAPTPISVILAGVLLKMGTYGLMRVSMPILPEWTRWFAPFLMALGFINIVYGSLCAMAQIRGVPKRDPKTGEVTLENDLKKLVAYSSVAHMGFCLLGLAAGPPAGLSGCLFQMWNHGIITGMLFLLVGVVYDRAHHRNIDGFGGLWAQMPVYGGLTALAFFASLGLPGLSGFISEALCFIGAFQAAPSPGLFGWFEGGHLFQVLTALSVSGVVLGAAYFLWSYLKIFLGPLNPKYADLTDCTGRELATLLPLAALVIVLGVWPEPILGPMQTAIKELAVDIAQPWVASALR